MYRLSALVFSAVLVFVSACGDGNLVDDFAACGGDVVGLWTIRDVDSKITGSPVSDCPTATGRFDQSGTGTIEFRSDNTYTVMIEFTGEAQVNFPVACLTDVTSCADLNNPQEELVCAGDVSSSCSCATPIDNAVAETGTWAVNGNEVTLTPENDTPNTLEYCADGNQLTVKDVVDDINLTVVYQATR